MPIKSEITDLWHRYDDGLTAADATDEHSTRSSKPSKPARCAPPRKPATA